MRSLDFPPRYRLADDGALATDYELIPLPRTGSVYTETTVHMPVPGLRTPYSLVIVELDGVGVRALVKVTGAEPGTVEIGDRGRTGAAPRRGALTACRTTVTCSSRSRGAPSVLRWAVLHRPIPGRHEKGRDRRRGHDRLR